MVMKRTFATVLSYNTVAVFMESIEMKRLTESAIEYFSFRLEEKPKP